MLCDTWLVRYTTIDHLICRQILTSFVVNVSVLNEDTYCYTAFQRCPESKHLKAIFLWWIGSLSTFNIFWFREEKSCFPHQVEIGFCYKTFWRFFSVFNTFRSCNNCDTLHSIPRTVSPFCCWLPCNSLNMEEEAI